MSQGMTSPADRRDLAEAARLGDRDALGLLWERLNPPLLRYCKARGCANADDVASAVWLDAARGLPRFVGDDDAFRRWLFTIAHHRVVDEVRRAVRRDEPEELTEQGAGTVDGPEGEVLAADGLERALQLVRRLPPDQAEVVALRVLADLDVATVASLVGRPPGTVRVLAHRGLARLAELLTTSGEMGSATARRVTPEPVVAMKVSP